MEINVKRIGTAYGTVGWLAKGLESGTLRISEGRMDGTGHHALWLQGDEIADQLLAAYNALDLTPEEYPQANTYEKVCAPGDVNHIACTDACWRSLMDVAEQWCDQCNEALGQEKPLSLKLIRVEEES